MPLKINLKKKMLLCVVRRYVSGGEEASAMADFSVPPVLIGTIRHGNDVASPELEFARFLWSKVI
jgi:hypothetical protein